MFKLDSLFKIFKSNKNRTRLEKLFNYDLYHDNYPDYIKIQENIKVRTIEDVDFILRLLKDLPCKNKYSQLFNPVEEILRYFTQNQNIPPKLFCYYYNNILPILKDIFNVFKNDSSGDSTRALILETLFCIQSEESINYLIELLSNKNNNLDDFLTYSALMRFVDTDKAIINIFFNNSEKLLTNNNFRTVAFVELFSQWTKKDVIPYNPVKNHLNIIEEWIKDKNNISYIISGCNALSTIKSEKSIALLKMASHHPKLEIQLESAFSLIILGEKDAKTQLKQFAQNPLISNKVFAYAEELMNHYQIDCGFTVEDILALVPDEDDFVAMSAMVNWCSYITEYGSPPNCITVWSKKEVSWPPNNKKIKVYLLKYKYDTDIEHVGYFNSDTGMAFSSHTNFDDVNSAYSHYFDFE